MATKQFILVTSIDARPRRGASQWFLNTAEIALAVQEFFDPAFSETDGYLPTDSTAEGAIPVVHIYLKPNLFGFPTMSLNTVAPEDDDITIVKQERPTDIWIAGFLENFYMLVTELTIPAEIEQLGEPQIAYGSLVITDTTIDFDITMVTDADAYYVAITGIIDDELQANVVQNDINTSISITGLTPITQYVVVLQARKNDLAYSYSTLSINNIETEAAP